MALGGAGQQLKLRLFLEGIEVPVIGAQVQMNLNAPATASIQVIPVDTITELRPRTMVHLFYWDFNYDLAARTDQDSGFSDGKTDSLDPDVQLDNYRLLFGGEVVGLVMAKTPTGRQAVLQCADWSTYWDTAYQTFISYSPSGNWIGDNSSMWSGANNMFNNFLSSHSAVMGDYLKNQPKTQGLQNVTGLMGGIISLLEAMGGVDKHVSGINDYFTIAEVKNHLLQQITADQKDNTSKKLFANKAFSAWLNRRTSSLGELVSFRDMLKLLFHWIYYEVVPCTCPKFAQGSRPTSEKGQERADIIKKRGRPSLVSGATRLLIKDLLLTTKRYDGSQGQSSTIERQLQGGEAILAQEVRSKLQVVIASDRGLNKKAEKIINAAIGPTKNIIDGTVPLGPGIKDEILFRNQKRLGRTLAEELLFKSLTELVDLGVISPEKEELLPGTQEARFRFAEIRAIPNKLSPGAGAVDKARRRYQLNQKEWKRITELLLQLLASGGSSRKKSKQSNKEVTVDRLQTQIFRPDCFFVAPPKCNVLFPDQITQFQYQRNFLQEITRLRLSTGTMFTRGKHGGFFQKSHMAPPLDVIKKIAESQGNRGIRTLLPWEIYTGILPKFEHISEVNYISNRASRKRIKVSKDLRGKGSAYAQRAANFNFLKYRFAPRSISVSAKFSPQFTLGFPALIIDKPYILEPEIVKKAIGNSGVSGAVDFSIGSFLANIDELSVAFKSPTQYLGMPAGVSHSVDQSGGVTSTTLTHARIHKVTDDDYLDALLEEVKRELNTTTVTTELDAVDLLARGDYTLLNLLIRCTSQTDVLSRIEKINRGEDPDRGFLFMEEIDLRPISNRPTAQPATLSQVSPTLQRINTTTSIQGRRVKISSDIQVSLDATKEGTAASDAGASGTKFTTLTGGTTKSTFLNTELEIDEPSPYGDLGKGGKGPKGGRIRHVQLPSNAVLSVSSADINGFVKSRKDKKALRKSKRRGGNPDTFFLWRKVIIHEEITSDKKVRDVPIEEAVRPPWFSPQYSNLFIGDDIYQPFFGCGSVVDQSIFLTPDGGGGAFTGNSEINRADRKELVGKIEGAGGDLTQVARILNDAKAKGIGTMSSIEEATDALSFMYGEVRRQGLDVQKFVSDYTHRPIATMRNIFGSLDLAYEKSADGKTLNKIAGEAGFHSTAVAPFEDLLGLVDNPDLEIPRIKRNGKKFPISRALDPRPGRRKRVQAYIDQVGASGGSLGVGILG